MLQNEAQQYLDTFDLNEYSQKRNDFDLVFGNETQQHFEQYAFDLDDYLQSV